jgi:hypothetical protein
MTKHKRLAASIASMAALATINLGVGSGAAEAFTPGDTTCTVYGTHFANAGAEYGSAYFTAVPNCTAYVRVVVRCRRDNGGTQTYQGSSKIYGQTSTYDCDWNGTYDSWSALLGHYTSRSS